MSVVKKQYFYSLIFVDINREELDLFLSFVTIMCNSNEVELYTYGMAFDEEEFGWFLYSTGNEVSIEQIYNIFPKEYVTI